MGLEDRMRFVGRAAGLARMTGFYSPLKREGCVNFVRMFRGDARWRHHQHRGAGISRWRRAVRCLPCWGLGAKAGWPWG
jgi:hypothetical protein